MNILDIVWIFVIFAALVPIIRQKMLDSARVSLIRKIEQMRGSRVVTLIHRQESMTFLGFPIARYIDVEDSEQILRAIQLTSPEIPIDLILHTPGGLVLASEQIAKALCKRPGKVTVIIPHYAMSGGTLIALAADEIMMDPNAVLGPVDPQVGSYPASSIINVLEAKPLPEIDDQTVILADVSRKAIAQVKGLVTAIASSHMAPTHASQLAEILTSGRWTHDYPISIDEARELGLNVTTDGFPHEVYQLMNLYPQSGQRRPSVEFIPIPYHTRPEIPERSRRRTQS